MSAERLRCFTLHAERLEDDRVWARTSALLSSLERRGGAATLFVHPFTAIRSGADLSERIGELLARGHEIGQHTHYYRAQEPGERGKPPTDLGPLNVRRRLDEDLAELRRAGADPRGFVAGGWTMSAAADGWLPGAGFAYDASARAFRLRYPHPQASAGDGWTAPRAEPTGLLLLPTTAPLRRAVAARARGAGGPDLRYDLVYVHDYDLVRPGAVSTARLLLARWGGGPWVTAGDLAAAWTARGKGADGS